MIENCNNVNLDFRLLSKESRCNQFNNLQYSILTTLDNFRILIINIIL